MSLIPAEAIIRDLAKRHGITAQRIKREDLAETIARVSDAEVESDEVQDLVVNLCRAKIISSDKALELACEYFEQKHHGI